jgi:hypothetical protein
MPIVLRAPGPAHDAPGQNEHHPGIDLIAYITLAEQRRWLTGDVAFDSFAPRSVMS